MHDGKETLVGSVSTLVARRLSLLDVPQQLRWMQERVEPGRGCLHLTDSRRADMILIGI